MPAFLISFRAGTQSSGETRLIQGFNAGVVDPRNSRSVTFLPAEPSYLLKATIETGRLSLVRLDGGTLIAACSKAFNRVIFDKVSLKE